MGELTRRRLEELRRLLVTVSGHGWTRVSSRDLGRWLGATAATVRRDLMETGSGHGGAAYELEELLRRLDEYLGPSPARTWALVGLGELGLALTMDGGFPTGWTFTVGFDPRPNRLETVEVAFPVFPTTEIIPVCRRLSVDSAVLALSATDAQRVAERLVQAGVRRLVNYSAVALRVNRKAVEVWERGFSP